jgi:hypothetical protein
MASKETRTRELSGFNPTVRDYLAQFLYGVGSGAPTDGVTGKGYAPRGSLYADRQNGTLYKNTGTRGSPTWNQVGGVLPAEVALDEGTMLIGDAAGDGVQLDVGNTSAGIIIGNGTTAAIAALSGDVTMSTAGAVTLKDSVLEGSNAANVANVNGGLPVVHRITMPSGANANTNVTLTHKTRVLDAWWVLAGAGTGGSSVVLSNTANVIVTSINVASGGDKDLFRAAAIDDTYHTIDAGGVLRATHASSSGDFPGAECYVLGIRVA